MEIEHSKPNYRQAGKQQAGRLIKGHIQDSLTEKTTSSIPYKFETILYRNTNPKGFGTSAQRVGRNDDLSPGPGSYDSDQVYSRSNSTSFSKKGYGNGFVSQANRLLYRGYMNTGPGPGAYNRPENPFQVTHIVQHQRREISEDLLKSKALQADLPGPGSYNPDVSKTSIAGNVHAVKSVFKSGTGRERLVTSINPPPGAYEIDRSLVEKKPFKHYLGSSNFMLPSKKKMSKETEDQDTIDKILGRTNETNKSVPGPGYYFKGEKDDESALFSHKVQDKNSPNFVVSNATRFGEVIQRKVKRIENPGPGSYETVPDTSQERTLVSGAVFMSETARQPFNNIKHFVGPLKYNPELLPKKSYHLNINKNWV